MKNKFIKLISITLISSMVITLVGCGKEEEPISVVEYGDVEDLEETTETTEEKEEDISLPYYDATNLAQAKEYTADDVIDEKSSYYKELLSSRPRKAFDGIYSAVNNLSTTVELESAQLISPEELKNVMCILFLDCPELFYLKTAYSYEVNAEGYVYKVYLEYSMTPEEIEEIKTNIAEQKPLLIDNRRVNDYETIYSLCRDINMLGYQSYTINDDGTYNKSCENPFNESYYNSIGYSKYITYWLRQLGISSTVVVGELVSDTLKNDYEMTTDYAKFCTESMLADGIYHIEITPSAYWMWNVVKIDDKWYNLDWIYGFLLNKTNKNNNTQSLWLVPDRTMSQTRLYYMNEEILGMGPSCLDMQFERSYREGFYILPHTETQSILRLKQEIASIDQENDEEREYQFEDEQTFNYFLENFDEQVDFYNKTYGNPIGKYTVSPCRDSLTINIL